MNLIVLVVYSHDILYNVAWKTVSTRRLTQFYTLCATVVQKHDKISCYEALFALINQQCGQL